MTKVLNRRQVQWVENLLLYNFIILYRKELENSRADILRRTGMPGAVIVRIKTRQCDSSISQNINSNRRSTKLILYITKY